MKTINEDILNIKEGIIVHQVNCQNVMGSGLAKALYTKYPEVKTQYHRDIKYKIDTENYTNKDFLGLALPVEIIPNNLYVINLFGQLNYGRDKNVVYTNYDAFRKGLESLIKDYVQAKIKLKGLPIYLPYKIGCGLANGNWDTILSILEDLEKEFNIEFIIVKKD